MSVPKIRLSSEQLDNLDLIVDHMLSGQYNKASRLIGRTSRSEHQFEPFYVTILGRTLELLIDPRSEWQSSLPPNEDEDQAVTRLNQLKLEEIMLTRMGLTPESLDDIFEEVVDGSSWSFRKSIKLERKTQWMIRKNIEVFHQHCRRAKATADAIARLEPTEGVTLDMAARYAVIIFFLVLLAAIFFEDFEMREPVS